MMEQNTDIHIRVFRAVEDPETCLKFIAGHRKVLTIYNIENITTNTDDWMYNPAIFVIVVESPDREKIYGGARVQAANGITPLPLEEATGKMDPKIYDIIKETTRIGTGELSGLWNSKEVAGLGIGSLFPTRVALVVADQVGIGTLFSLCSPTTVRFNQWLGSKVYYDVGNNGTFYYPNIDLLATICYIDDMVNFGEAHPREREKLLHLKHNPTCVMREKSPFKNLYINVHYDLIIPSANKNEFKLTF